MKHISSRENPDYRLLQRVVAGKRVPGERSTQRFALEGVHLCEGWLGRMGQPDMAFFDESRVSRPDVAALMGAVDPRQIRLCETGLLNGVSPIGQDQGVIFIAQAPRLEAPLRLRENCLWLDRVQDPGNMGTLLRTAAAAGMREVYASMGCVAAWSPKVLRSGQGAHFALNIYEGQDLPQLRGKLEIPMVVTSLDDACDLYRADLPDAVAWVFGNEGQGVDKALVRAAELRIHIPQTSGVESLNVAVAAGVCLFEQRRRLLAAVP